MVPRNNAKLGWLSRLPLMKKLLRLKTFLFLELFVGRPILKNNRWVLRLVGPEAIPLQYPREAPGFCSTLRCAELPASALACLIG